MQSFALFSEPIIRFVDKLVGATNAMRVDITARDAKSGKEETATLRMAHDDLESLSNHRTLTTSLFHSSILTSN